MSTLDYKLLRYNAIDAAATIEIWNSIKSDLDTRGYYKAYDMTMSFFPALMAMQTRGICVNATAMEQTKIDITNKRLALQEELNQLCGFELNCNSPKQCAQYFYVTKGRPTYYNKDGGVTTDDKALQRLARGTAKMPGLREARLVQDIRGLVKLYGTYLDIDFDADGRLRCSYNPRGTKFGRLSSSATVFGTGTNLQNLPQEFKKFLVPDPGYFLWEIDKRQAEWIVVAYLSGDANMISVIESGDDPHIHTAHLMYGIPKDVIAVDAKLLGGLMDRDEVRKRRQDNEKTMAYVSTLPAAMSARQIGKKSNHGLNYDEGFNTFALQNEIEIAESKRIVALYHKIYPGIGHWYEATRNQLSKDRTLTNTFGRKIRFLDAWGDTMFKSAYSAIPQSSVGDCTNIGMRDIYDSDLTSLTGGTNLDILAQVHDSVLMQVPLSILSDDHFISVVKRCYGFMESEMEYNGRRFKIPTDSKVGMNWAGFHATGNPEGMQEVDITQSATTFMDSVRKITKWQTGT